jgi:energy-coupling factor transporter ATP-binding protein EcfA2
VDIENRMAIETIMGDIRDAGRSSIIFCTHDVSQAARLTDMRLHLAGGRLNGADYENTFHAAVHREGKQYWGRIGRRFRFPLPSTSEAVVRVAVNPRLIEIAAESPSPDKRANNHGRIIRMDEEMDGVRLMVDVGLPLAVILSCQAYRAADFRIGDTVLVRCPSEALSLL